MDNSEATSLVPVPPPAGLELVPGVVAYRGWPAWWAGPELALPYCDEPLTTPKSLFVWRCTRSLGHSGECQACNGIFTLVRHSGLSRHLATKVYNESEARYL